MQEQSKFDDILESIYEELGADGVVDSLSFLFGAFAVTKDGIIISANAAFQELIGLQLEDLREVAVVDLVADEEKEFLRDIFANNLTEPYEITLSASNGVRKNARVFPKLFHVHGKVYRLAEFVDFSDAHTTQAELKASEEKFRAVFYHAGIGCALISATGEWKNLNQKMCDILGYPKHELRTLRYVDVSYEDDLEEDFRLLKELSSGARTYYSEEKRLVRKDGRVIWGRLTVSLIRDSSGAPAYFVVLLEDIDVQRQLVEKLKLSDRIVSASTDLLAVFDVDGNYLAVNDAYAAAFGRSREEFINLKDVDVLGETFYDPLMLAKLDEVKKCRSTNFGCWFDFPAGGRRYMNVSYSPFMDTHSHCSGYAVSARDITELKLAEIEMRALNEKLERFSFIDGLTKITNRRMFDESLDKEWNRALRADVPLSLIMIDIDFFKKYNDHYGHLRGDDCLVKIAETLKDVASRSSDTVARYGGEEFAILAPSSNLEQAIKLAERCRCAIIAAQIPHETTEVEGLKVVSVSIGVSSLTPSITSSPLTLIDIADKRLYKAKRSGRNCVVAE